MKERSHLNVKFVICHSSHFNTHIASVHEENKPFKCEIYKADFFESNGFQIHIELSHEGKKKFTCEICDASFGRKDILNRP